MQEKRKFSRWYPVMQFTTDIFGEQFKENARVMDISAAGMKACLSCSSLVGDTVYGKLEIPFNTIPFFVKGEVTRARRIGGHWETAIKFNKVSTSPFAGAGV